MNKFNDIYYRCLKSIFIIYYLLIGIYFSINCLILKYPGNNYLPIHTIFLTLISILSFFGCQLLFGSYRAITLISYEFFLYLFIIVSLSLGATAIQYTPFPPIDLFLIKLEHSWFGAIFIQLMNWFHQHLFFIVLLEKSYDSLVMQIIIIPLIMVIFLKYHKLHEYYCLLLISAIFGYSFYYFFPTTAPATNIISPYFTSYQYATGLKFFQLHHYIKPITHEGGMIAFPSFHVIWSWFGLYLLRDKKWLMILYSPIFILLTMSCVVLGWHYPLDIIGSFIIIVMSHLSLKIFKQFNT